LAWQHHGLMVRHLACADCSRLAAREIRAIVGHHLFESAGDAGRQNALADPCHTLMLLGANTLPDAAKLKQQAPGLMAKHLGRTEPGARKILHQWVLDQADHLTKAFFERRPGSRSKRLLGDRFVNAYGRDWYQQCIGMMSKASVRAACRGDLIALEAGSHAV
jgi:hypothetical protein